MKTIALISTLFLLSCGAQEEPKKENDKNGEAASAETNDAEKKAGNITALSVDEFEKQIQQPGTLLDVRTPGEVVMGTIPNATIMDFNGPDFTNQLKTLDKSKPVYVYCKSGGRSGQTAILLSESGYEVYNLDGGFDAWKAAGKDYVTE